MGSSLTALVATAGVELETEVAERGLRAVRLPQAMTLVPLVGDWCADWQQAELQFDHLSTPLLQWLQMSSVPSAIAYLEQTTFAGDAMSGAAIWREGRVVWGPHFTCNIEVDAQDPYVWAPDMNESAVNRALHELGVEPGREIDEYAALGLHLKRNTADWLA
jgi:hypothetical protein